MDDFNFNGGKGAAVKAISGQIMKSGIKKIQINRQMVFYFFHKMKVIFFMTEETFSIKAGHKSMRISVETCPDIFDLLIRPGRAHGQQVQLRDSVRIVSAEIKAEIGAHRPADQDDFVDLFFIKISGQVGAQ